MASEDVDAFLASLGEDPVPKKNKKKKNKKKGGAADTASAATPDPTPAAAPKPPASSGSGEPDAAAAAAAAAAAPDASSAADAFLAALGGDEPTTGGKKKKKKKKTGGAAAAAPADSGEAADSPAASSGKGKKGKKPSAAAKLALERARRVKEEQEAAAAAAEAQRLAEEEAARKAAEEEEKRLALQAAKKEKARLKRERQRAEGTYKTKAQKAKEAAAAARLAQMKAAGLIVGLDDNDGGGGGGGGNRDCGKGKGKKGRGKGKGRFGAAAPVTEKVDPDAVAAASEEGPEEETPEESWEAEADAEADSSKGAAAGAGAGTAGSEGGSGPEDWEAAADGPEDDWETFADDEDAELIPDALIGSGIVDDDESESLLEHKKRLAAEAKDRKKRAEIARSSQAARAAQSAKLTMEERIDASRERRRLRNEAAEAALSPDHLRSPICCVLGHVDTGKTKLLDKIRRTNVQDGEAGGITQQIGATYFPMERLAKQTDKLNKDLNLEYKVPGLLMIDTPGHESFTNLRSRGSGLCDIAVLVVDLMHGLEPQTVESLNLLRQRRTPFIVALNKIDRVYGWKELPNSPVRDSLREQEDYAIREFEDRTQGVLTQLAEQSLNAQLYYENEDFRRVVSVVPTSAHTGEGIPDLLMLLVQLTQQLMSRKLMFSPVIGCTVLEVKAIEGFGTTIDVVLVNGELHEGDTIVVCGMNGPIVTPIRALLTPQPMKEIRVKGEYVHHKRIQAAMGIKIAANQLDKAVAGTSLMVVHPEDEIEDLKLEVMEDLEHVMGSLAKEAHGVFVQASTLGSLEALMEYLRTREPPVPVAGVNIGPIHKKDVVAASTMLEHKREYATILAFDVRVSADAIAAAAEFGVTIFTADIIYHLTDQFDEFMKGIKRERQAAAAGRAVFPCILKIVPDGVFMKKSPLLLGVDVVEGTVKIGTPLAVVTMLRDVPVDTEESKTEVEDRKITILGRVTSIEHNREALTEAKAGGPSVAIKLEVNPGDASIVYGRHFDASHMLYSRLTRESIDSLKEEFRDEMTKKDWKLVVGLKKLFKIA